MDKKLVKQDINFLEFPLWFQDKDSADQARDGYLWKDPKGGFVYKAAYKPPTKVDLIFLLAVLRESQKDGWSHYVELSRFKLLKICGVEPNNFWYNRLQESLDRWMNVTVEFQGSFYDGCAYKTLKFGIVDSWGIEKEKNNVLRIWFSPNWLLCLENSDFFKMLDFEQIKQLRSPLATRLHEILRKTFQGRDSWSIDAKKLAEKIPLAKKYPAHILPKIKSAVKRINAKTDLSIRLEVEKPRRGKAILTFHKEDSKAGSKAPAPSQAQAPPEKRFEIPEELRGLLSEKLQELKSVQKAIEEALTEHGLEYTRRNLLYTDVKAKKNPRVFLLKALKEDWAEDWYKEHISPVEVPQQTDPVPDRFLEDFLEETETNLARWEQIFLEHYSPQELELMWSFARQKVAPYAASEPAQRELQIKLKLISLIKNRLKALPS